MMYLKINEDNTITYPYSISQLKNDNPNTSFFEIIPLQTLLDYNVHIVNSIEKGDDYTKNYTEGTPQLIDGQYFQNWVITNATQEQIDFRISSKWDDIRLMRNQYLSECDWTILPDSPLSESKKSEWSIYRQALRDITLQTDPFNIVWPTKPE